MIEPLTKVEAIKKMTNGDKVKQLTMGADGFLMIGEGGMFVDEDGDIQDINMYPFHNWSIYTQPKTKGKMWQWVYSFDGIIDTTPFAINEEHAKHKAGCQYGQNTELIKIIQRADWTEIEA